MHLFDRIASAEAAATGILAAGNAAYCTSIARRARRPARRVAAASLLLLNLALAAEAALYLAVLPHTAAAIEGAALLATRGLALLAAALVSALLLRSGGGPR